MAKIDWKSSYDYEKECDPFHDLVIKEPISQLICNRIGWDINKCKVVIDRYDYNTQIGKLAQTLDIDINTHIENDKGDQFKLGYWQLKSKRDVCRDDNTNEECMIIENIQADLNGNFKDYGSYFKGLGHVHAYSYMYSDKQKVKVIKVTEEFENLINTITSGEIDKITRDLVKHAAENNKDFDETYCYLKGHKIKVFCNVSEKNGNFWRNAAVCIPWSILKEFNIHIISLERICLSSNWSNNPKYCYKIVE
jgi:hypothetical protein